MFEWLFGKKKDIDIRELSKLFKNGITININVSGISGNTNEQERRNSLEERRPKVDAYPAETRETPKRTKKEDTISSVPNLSKLKTPQVNFGEEKEG